MLARVFSHRYDSLRRTFSTDFSRDPGVTPEHLRVIRRGGRIVAHAGVYEKQVRIGRAVLRMGGLGCVACAPEFRGEGLASACVRDALAFMRHEGIPLSFLFGIDRFYTRFGYAGCLPRYEMKIACRELTELRNPFETRPQSARDLPELVRLYEAASKDTPGAVVRDARRFGLAIERNGLAGDPRGGNGVFVFREGRSARRARAYAVWKDGSLWEVGLEGGDEAACQAVLAWLRSRCEEMSEKELHLTGLSPAHPLWRYALRFNHSRETGLSWTGGGMGRIVDVAAFLEAVRPELEARVAAVGIEAECHLRLEVDGSPHELVLGRTHQFARASSLVMVARVRCSQQALLQMTLGTLPFDSIPGVAVEGERALVAAAFPESSPCIYRLDAF